MLPLSNESKHTVAIKNCQIENASSDRLEDDVWTEIDKFKSNYIY